MGLTLATLRCPDAVPPESRRVAGGEFSIGRGAENDWVLPDPERHISKRHCVLAYRSGQWQLADTSSNGTFLNRETTPVGAARTLRSGDRIRCGTYEIEVTIEEEEQRGFTPEMLDPFADEPKAAPSAFGFGDPMLQDRSDSGHSALLPSDFDPLGPEDDPFQGPTHSDHAPAVNDAFRPPPLPASVIPDDWELDMPATPPPAAMAPPTPSRVAQPIPLPPDDDDSLFAPPPAAQPPVPPTPLIAEAPPRSVAPPASPVAASPVAPPLVATPAMATPAEPGGLLAAFLRGIGLADIAPPDPARTLEAAGAALRATVSGIRQALIARASIKGEFRIEQTMVRASGNNPLKFSAGDDDALAAFLGVGRRSTMPPDQAVTEALRDMRLHELATVTAMQSAVRALLAQFDPASIEKAVEGGGGLVKLPGQQKARAWDNFAAMHTKVSQALADDFDSVFGKAFARAYEQAMREASSREDRP